MRLVWYLTLDLRSSFFAELVLIVCCHLPELSLTLYIIVCTLNFKVVVGNSKNPVKRQIHYSHPT